MRKGGLGGVRFAKTVKFAFLDSSSPVHPTSGNPSWPSKLWTSSCNIFADWFGTLKNGSRLACTCSVTYCFTSSMFNMHVCWLRASSSFSGRIFLRASIFPISGILLSVALFHLTPDSVARRPFQGNLCGRKTPVAEEPLARWVGMLPVEH